MTSKKKRDIESLAAIATNACNDYVDARFRDNNYEDYTIEEKLRIIRVLKTNAKLDARYQA
tara:strand:+ start:576 stop:758 length:183 start_codon:yes stop_codon:yes gene_type:complete